MPFSQSKKPGALQLFAYILKPKKWHLPRIPAFSGGLFGSGKAKGQPHKRLTCKFDGANGRTRTGDPRITNAESVEKLGLTWLNSKLDSWIQFARFVPIYLF